jgi:hypothetical protein
MSEPTQRSEAVAGFSPPPLPGVESPPPEEVLDGVPSPEEIIEQAEAAADIVGQQPDVDELLHRSP